MPSVATTTQLINATLTNMGELHRLSITALPHIERDANSETRWSLFFRRMDAEGQTLIVPVESCHESIEPLIDAVKTGIMLLGDNP
jgi:hypothetical protein